MRNEISFWNYLGENKIIIPIIQRDYAQGRAGKETLRNLFLTNLKQALDHKLPDGEKKLKLDFVYGAKEDDIIKPLDGQQRLTTLWLLHWFIAYKAGKLTEVNRKRFSRFSYETRISSIDFCKALAMHSMPDNYEILKFIRSLKAEEQPDGLTGSVEQNIVGTLYNSKDFNATQDAILREFHVSSIIRSQTWFYSYWEQDPTIQSMLRMLGGSFSPGKDGSDIIDGLEELFAGTERDKFVSYWNELTDTNESPIVFYQLPMHDYDLSDDLYIKMNARGKQLTDFENFKADLIGYLREKQKEEEEIIKEKEEKIENEWSQFLDEVKGVPIKMDTTWTDIFWNPDSPRPIDSLYFTFLNRFFLNFRIKDIKDENDRYYAFFTDKGADKGDIEIVYRDFHHYKWEVGPDYEISKDFFNYLVKVMNTYHSLNLENKDFQTRFSQKFRFIPEFEENDISTVNQVGRVAFYAICKFLNDVRPEQDADEEKTALKRWMRVVWNLISIRTADGREAIRNVTAIKNAVKILDFLDTHNVYKSLISNEDEINDTFADQFREEIEKAKIILDEDGSSLRAYPGEEYSTWEEAITDAESTSFFNGTIRFLFTDKTGKPDWALFGKKLSKTKEYFPDTKKVATLLIRNYLRLIDNPELLKRIGLNSESYSWMNLLTDKEMNKYTDIFLTSAICDGEVLESFVSPLEDVNMKLAHQDLVRSEITDYLRHDNFFTVSNNGYVEVVPPRKWAWYNKIIIGHPRNRILISGIADGRIDTPKKRDASGFIWGDDIDFSYKSERHNDWFYFRWLRKKEMTDSDIYNMTISDGKWDYTLRHSPDINSSDQDKKSYISENIPSPDMTVEDFYNLLDSLIDRRDEDRKAE